MRILVVDDEEIKRISLVDDLVEGGYDASAACDGEEALRRLSRERFDLVITDLRMPGIDGMEILKHVKLHTPDTEVVMMTAYGSIPLAVEAMKVGASNFITKPFHNEFLFPLLERIREHRPSPSGAVRPKKPAVTLPLEEVIVGHSTAIRDVRRMVDLCSRNDATVLVTGETGTGKDLIAHAIHDYSARRTRPFIKVNCSTFSDHLIESALFGHTKGSFTGADHQNNGKLDLAQHGTLFLDDVDDIPLVHQIKLLRVIEEKVYERVGSPDPIEADVRIIAATKHNLLAETEKGTFRSDLYYRLNVLRIDLPPLRNHIEDLPELIRHHLGKITQGQEYRMTDDAMQRLCHHSWPGNVRELAHTLERAYLTGNGMITTERMAIDPIEKSAKFGNGGFKETVQQTERDLLENALKQAHGNKSEAARILDMKLSSFRDKLAKHGLA
ncbi:MAG: sigma-54-dependent Fis family transcriptional regulator [Phycisphaerae bacterium]|nr:sigma-54-dependent Fis family transcriptional regulator [Phycisphaerae bacterium]